MDSLIFKNRLLASLPRSEYQVLFSNLEKVSLTLNEVIYQLHQQIDYIYFPIHSMVSLVAMVKNNSTTEIITIGKEGLIGFPVFLGVDYATSKAIVLVADRALKLPALIFKQESQREGKLQKQLLLYAQVRLTQMSQNIVCKSHHSIEKQFARWLLCIHDCVNQDRLILTQKLIAQMLGVRRASVTEIAIKFQKASIISYSRGCLIILNRAALELIVCECYELVKAEFHQLLDFS